MGKSKNCIGSHPGLGYELLGTGNPEVGSQLVITDLGTFPFRILLGIRIGDSRQSRIISGDKRVSVTRQDSVMT
jgi:hypothetical protein